LHLAREPKTVLEFVKRKADETPAELTRALRGRIIRYCEAVKLGLIDVTIAVCRRRSRLIKSYAMSPYW